MERRSPVTLKQKPVTNETQMRCKFKWNADWEKECWLMESFRDSLPREGRKERRVGAGFWQKKAGNYTAVLTARRRTFPSFFFFYIYIMLVFSQQDKSRFIFNNRFVKSDSNRTTVRIILYGIWCCSFVLSTSTYLIYIENAIFLLNIFKIYGYKFGSK